MRNIIIAFDVDGCILNNGGHRNSDALVRENVVELIKHFYFDFQNVSLICWSWNGQEYAEEVLTKHGLKYFFTSVHSKWKYDKVKYGNVDIAFDDLPDFVSGDKNLILK